MFKILKWFKSRYLCLGIIYKLIRYLFANFNGLGFFLSILLLCSSSIHLQLITDFFQILYKEHQLFLK